MNPEPDFFVAQVSHARRFYLDLHPSPEASLAVVSGGREQCAADYHNVRAGFPYLSVEYVAEGEGTLRLGGQTWPLVPGTAFAYGPGVPHEIHSSANNPMVKYFVDFTGKRTNQLLAQASLPPGSVIQVSDPIQVVRSFEQLVDEGVGRSRFTIPLCTVLLEYLLLRLASAAIPYGSQKSRAFRTYQRCRHFIETHCLELHSMREIAEACRVDHAYLCRLFKRFDHLTPYQCLLQLKMNRAAELLQEPGKRIKDVAHALDFADPYHFSRVFKRVHGVSPGRFAHLRTAAPFGSGSHALHDE
ncbi:MAG: AraC family transcriptional regulator [bacterium]|nr:AraC family transcriptional regulator [bacterium]